MKKIIITPLYYIDKTLRAEIDSARGADLGLYFVITDDVSPIFPLERRMEWLDLVFFAQTAIIDSIVQSDESKEFITSIKAKIDSIKEEGDIVVFYSTVHAHKNLKRFGDVRHKMASPLDADIESILDETFAVRFGKEFGRYTKPKDKYIPGKEYQYIIPYFMASDGKRYLGFLYDYNEQSLLPLKIDTTFKPPVAEIKFKIARYTEGYFGTPIGSEKLIGWLEDNYWIIEITQPDYISLDKEKSFRDALSIDADTVFIAEEYLSEMSIPLFHWIKTGISKTLDYVEPEQDA